MQDKQPSFQTFRGHFFLRREKVPSSGKHATTGQTDDQETPTNKFSKKQQLYISMRGCISKGRDPKRKRTEPE